MLGGADDPRLDAEAPSWAPTTPATAAAFWRTDSLDQGPRRVVPLLLRSGTHLGVAVVTLVLTSRGACNSYAFGPGVRRSDRGRLDGREEP